MWETMPPRPNDAPPPIQWRDMDDAPRNGDWLLLDVDDGTKDGADYVYSNIFVGRWNPKNFPDLGSHFYEWEVIDRSPDSRWSSGEITTHYSDGMICGWLPFPATSVE